MSSATAMTVPGGMVIAIPGDWFAIKVPHKAGDAERLAGEAVAIRPELAGHQDAVRELFGWLVEAARKVDVVAAYAKIVDVADGLLPVTLVLAISPMGRYALDSVAEEMASQRHEGLPTPVTGMFDLPAGRTVRIEQFEEWPGPAPGRRPVSFIVQYVTEVPVDEAALRLAIMLTFSTPAVALAGQLRQLFHQIACTVRFDATERVR